MTQPPGGQRDLVCLALHPADVTLLQDVIAAFDTEYANADEQRRLKGIYQALLNP